MPAGHGFVTWHNRLEAKVLGNQIVVFEMEVTYKQFVFCYANESNTIFLWSIRIAVKIK